MREIMMNSVAIIARPVAFNSFAPLPPGSSNVGLIASIKLAAQAAGDASASTKDDLGARSKDSEAMLPYWQLTDDIITGYDAIKAGADRYLPKFADEDKNEYEYRLANGKFTNTFRDICESLSAKPFEEEITLTVDGEDDKPSVDGEPQEKKKLPPEIEAFIEDVDGAGNNITSFGANTFFNGIASCIDWIFVDYPTVDPTIIKTKDDEKKAGIKPFWSHVLGINVLEAKCAVVNGNEQLIKMRILEPGSPNHIRVFEAVDGGVAWGLFEERLDADGKGKTYILMKSGMVTIGVIPLVPFYTGRRQGRTFKFFPVMRDAADLQIQLYRQESGLNFAKVMAAYPMLAGNGIKPEMDADGKTPKRIAVGPSRVLYSPPDGGGNVGNWDYVSPDAAILKFLADDVKETQQQLRELGRLPLTAQSGNLTVITTAFAAGKAKSAVSAWGLRLKDALENALKMTCAWMNIDNYGPQVNVYDEYDNFTDNGADLAALGTARAARDLSQRTYWSELQRRKVLKPEFDADAEEALLLNETPSDDDTVEDDGAGNTKKKGPMKKS